MIAIVIQSKNSFAIHQDKHKIQYCGENFQEKAAIPPGAGYGFAVDS